MDIFDTAQGVNHGKVGMLETNKKTKCACDSFIKNAGYQLFYY